MSRLRPILPSFVAFLIPLLLAAPQALSQTPRALKANDEAYREYMVSVARQLGVTCNTCHDPENFSSLKKPEIKIAKEHIRLTQLLIDNGMSGEKNKPKADCFMCHRGKLIPDYREPYNPMIMDSKKAKKKIEVPQLDPEGE